MASEYRQLLLSMGPVVWVDGVDGTHLQEPGNSPVLKSSNGLNYALNSGTGPIVGGAASVVAGEKSYCCLIGGLKSAAEVPGLTDLLTSGFSTVAIVKPRSWSGSWNRIISFGQAFINGEIIFSRYNNQNNLHIGWWNGTTSGPFLVTTNNALTLGKEQLVVATWSPADGKARLYMDGVKVAESEIAGPATNVNRKIFAVGQNCGTTELFDGYITLPAVFLRALTDEEIAALAAKSTVKGQHLSGSLPLSPRMTGGVGQVIGRTQFSGDIAFRATPDATGAWSADIASIGVDLDFTGIIGRGPGQLAGVVPNVTSILGVPTSAEVRVLYRPDGGGVADGEVIASVTSGVDGTWSVDSLDPALAVDVVCRKDGYNDLIWSQVQPAAYPPLWLSGSFEPDATTFALDGAINVSGHLGALQVEAMGDSPPGISFSASGGTIVASGRCYQPGTYSWSLKVTDGRSNVGQINCIVTMASLWVPSRLAAKPKLWVDDQSQITADSSGKVSLWADRSGNAWHLGQATAAAQPQALANELGGQRVIRFDGTDDVMGTSAADALGLFRNVPKGWVFSVVKRRGAGAAISTLFSVPRSVNQSNGIRFGVYASLAATSKPGVGGRRVDTDTFGSFTSASSVQDTWYLRLDLLEWDTRTASLWRDGALDGQATGLWAAAGNSEDVASGGSLGVGGSYTASGFAAELFAGVDVAAVLAGTGVPSTDEIDKLFGWAAWYFGLTARLPAGHPYKSVKPTI